MIGSLVRLVLFRFLGARVMLALAVFGFLRRLFGARREDPVDRPRRSGEPTTPRQARQSPASEES